MLVRNIGFLLPCRRSRAAGAPHRGRCAGRQRLRGGRSCQSSPARGTCNRGQTAVRLTRPQAYRVEMSVPGRYAGREAKRVEVRFVVGSTSPVPHVSPSPAFCWGWSSRCRTSPRRPLLPPAVLRRSFASVEVACEGNGHRV
jgi:hypothetical protein